MSEDQRDAGMPETPEEAEAALLTHGCMQCKARQPYTVEAEGFFARVIQHECDHLEGGVYLDRMDGLRSLSFLREFERFVVSSEDE